jgi:hypothetical protein
LVGGNSRCGIFRTAGDGDAVTGPGCSKDWQATMLEAAAALRRPFLACAACVVVLSAGCTMCPDPYDYSGPVPNGSAPQNDFQARSNGILPTGVSPRPFPPVVKAEPQSDPVAVGGAERAAEEPVVEEPVAEEPQLAEAADDVLRLSAEEPAAEDPVADVPAADAVDEPAEREAAESPAAEVAVEPALQETPGWRSRR